MLLAQLKQHSVVMISGVYADVLTRKVKSKPTQIGVLPSRA
ncbi:hypothetical protein SP19_75 [Salmonella phage 19]|nr:hypothetical protein SP19_75 [Salmonella phage 19]